MRGRFWANGACPFLVILRISVGASVRAYQAYAVGTEECSQIVEGCR